MINLIIDILKADANITAITTTSRIYPVSRLEGGVIPAIVVQLTNTDPADTHDNTTNMDVHTVQVSVIEDRPKEAHALAELCRSALDGYTGGTIAECRFINQATDVFESIDLYTQTMLFRVMLVRDNATLPTALADLGIFELDDVSDVNAPNPTDGQALIYDDATGTWIPGDVSATLAALTDVNLDEPLDREALVYDEVTSLWINGGPAKIDFPVTNNYLPGFTIGQVVGFNGEAQGDRPRIVPFSASSSTDPRSLVGVCIENMAYRANGHVRSYGTIYGVNTLAYPVGTILYASTTAGELTATPPTAPNHRIALAVVTRQHVNTGRIFVRTYTPAYRLADLSNVASTSPTTGQGLVWNGTAWAPGSVGYTPGSPPPGGFLGNVFYQDNAGNLTFEDEFRYTASTNTLAVENITGITVTGTGVVKGSNTFGQRYATQAATNRALANTASLTVERYFTVTAEGNGESFNIQSNTPSAGNKIVRKIWYKNEAFEATDVNTWTLLHTFADDTAYSATETQWDAYLEGQTYGKPPFTLALSWEDVPAFTGLLDTYSGAAAAYSVRLLDSTYTGSCIRVRRASDNTEQDIGFTLAGDFDTSALATFCAGTNGFIRTWYDQTGGGYDLIQTTSANQPKIYDSSTGVELENALAALRFDGTNDGLNCATNLRSATGASTVITVMKVPQRGSVQNTFSFYKVQRNVIETTGVTNYNNFSVSTNETANEFVKFTTANLANQVMMFAWWDGTSQLSTVDDTEVSQNGSVLSQTAGTVTLGASASGTNSIGFRNDISSQYSLGTIQEVIVYLSDQSSNRAGIETNINDAFTIYGQTPTGMLADYPGAAAAYSVRQLISTARYAMAVRRASDNAVLPIGFVNGDLDTTTLAAFCSGTNGFVAVWYDQSGNGNHATQTTTGNQPKIYDSATGVITQNSEAALEFDGSDDTLSGSSWFNSVGYGVVFAVHRQFAQTSEKAVWTERAESTGFTRAALAYTNASNTGISIGGRRVSSDTLQRTGNQTWSGSQFLTSSHFKWADAILESYINGASNGTLNPFQTAGNTNTGGLGSVIGGVFGGLQFNGRIQEIVVYASDQSSNRSAIETNINDYFNIF